MFRQARFLVFTTALTVGGMVAAPSLAQAQQTEGVLSQSVAAVASMDTPSFLVKGLATNAAQGQQSSSGQVRHEGVGIGAKFGFLWPSIAEAQGGGFEDNTGWLVGIFFGGNRPGTIGVMGELQYGKRSASFGETDFTQYFIEIPVLARVNAGSNSLNGILGYFLIGPVFDINLTSKLEDVKIEDQYESLDIGMLVGGGVEITRFIVEARFNKGFKNVLKSTGGDAEDIKSKSFAVQFGIRFN
jgi:hypothetical protein